jgi:hypothetical protein
VPPLFTNGLLFLLAIIILASIFKNYKTIKDIFAAKPWLKRKYLIIEWLNGNALIFPEFSMDRPTGEPKNKAV